MIKFLWMVLFVCFISAATGQVMITSSASKQKKASPVRTKIQEYLQSAKFYLEKRGEVLSDLDSAMFFAQRAEGLSNQMHLFCEKGDAIVMEGRIFREMGKRELAQTYLFRAIEWYKKYNCMKEIGDAYVLIGENYQNDPVGIVKKIDFYKTALPYFIKAGDQEAEGEAYKHIGDFYYVHEDNYTALDYLQKALAVFKKIKFKKMHFVYDLLAVVYIQIGQYDLALRYEFLAINVADDLKDTSSERTAMYYHASLIYREINQLNKAIVYSQKGLEIAMKNKNKADIQIMRNNLVNLFNRIGKYDKAFSIAKKNAKDFPPATSLEKVLHNYQYLLYYSKTGRFAEAKHYSNKLLDLLDQVTHEHDLQATIAQGMILYLQESGQFKLSNRYIKLFANSVAQLKNPLVVVDIERLYFKSDSATGNYIGAIRHFQRAGYITDSVLKVNSSIQMSKMMVEFETEKKDKDLKISIKDNQLLSRRAQIQENALKNEKVIRNVTLGGIMMMVLVFALGYNRFLLKQQSERKLKAQQEFINNQNSSLQGLLGEKEWLLKEIHHRVKNNLQIVISLLNTQSLYLDNIDAIEIINKSQNRMQVISLIHQKLYQTDNLATIDVNAHINELVNYLKDYFDVRDDVKFELDILPLKLDISRAVPLGLILNEAISNCLKYAFKDQKNAKVTIILKSTALDEYILHIKDNGKGLSDHFEINESTSLGMSLMQGLSDQIGGEFILNNEKGLEIMVVFNNPTNPLTLAKSKLT